MLLKHYQSIIDISWDIVITSIKSYNYIVAIFKILCYFLSAVLPQMPIPIRKRNRPFLLPLTLQTTSLPIFPSSKSSLLLPALTFRVTKLPILPLSASLPVLRLLTLTTTKSFLSLPQSWITSRQPPALTFRL